MKRNLFILFLFCVGSSLYACHNGSNVFSELSSANNSSSSDIVYDWEKNRKGLLASTDMVLFYGGGHHRNPYKWDKDRVSPYVCYVDKDNKSHWLFDSFLFLEIMDKGIGGGNKMFAKGYKLESANQTDWLKLIDYYLQSETGVGAIDAAVKETVSTLGLPKQKRQIVIAIPEPIVYQHPERSSSSTKYWGQIDNKTLDFSNSKDRIKACKWYIDQVRAKFNEKQYQHVELAGFYWIAEQAADTRDILSAVAVYLNDLKYSFNWIPYYNAVGYNQWKSLGFNYAYFQPNYFFRESTPDSRLDDACRKALTYDMHMEIEFDDNALNRRGRGYRLKNYMNAFKKYGIWEKKRLAYYQGGSTLLALKKSKDPVDIELYHEFCQFVITRPIRNSH